MSFPETTPLDLEIRRLKEHDVVALARLFSRNSVASVTQFFHPFPLTEQTAGAICTRQAAGEDIYAVAACGAEFVGFYMLRGWDEGFPIPSFGIFVDREHQGRGVGRLLTARALQDAREREASAVRLTVAAENIAAIAIYQEYGFMETERRETAAGQVLVMHCNLTPVR